LHYTRDIIPVIKPRRMGWAWHVAHMGVRRNMYRVFDGKPAGWRPLEDLNVPKMRI